MLHANIVVEQSSLEAEYKNALALHFPRLEQSFVRGGTTIAVSSERGLIGGATFQFHAHLAKDEELRPFLVERHSMPATRITRVWAKCGYFMSLVPKALEALQSQCQPYSFVYGHLVIPREYIERYLDQFLLHAGWLAAESKMPANVPNNKCRILPTSEGWRLFKLYRRLGAVQLGPVIFNPRDHQARVFLGIQMEEIDLHLGGRP